MPIASNPLDNGVGIIMGQGMGGAMVNMMEAFVTMPYYSYPSLRYRNIVNKQAQRFINKDCYHSRVAYHVFLQLGDRVYLFVGADKFGKPVYLNADFAVTGETVAELKK
jgi:hypothetical protein